MRNIEAYTEILVQFEIFLRSETLEKTDVRLPVFFSGETCGYLGKSLDLLFI